MFHKSNLNTVEPRLTVPRVTVILRFHCAPIWYIWLHISLTFSYFHLRNSIFTLSLWGVASIPKSVRGVAWYKRLKTPALQDLKDNLTLISLPNNWLVWYGDDLATFILPSLIERNISVDLYPEARPGGGFGGYAPPNTKFSPPKFVKVSPSITEDEYIYAIKTQLMYIQSTPLNRVTSGPGYFDPIKRRNLLTENMLFLGYNCIFYTYVVRI